jgi:hypothetical protein
VILRNVELEGKGKEERRGEGCTGSSLAFLSVVKYVECPLATTN